MQEHRNGDLGIVAGDERKHNNTSALAIWSLAVENLGLGHAWFQSAHPDLLLASPDLFRDPAGEILCGCSECDPYKTEGAGQSWDPEFGHGSVATHTKGASSQTYGSILTVILHSNDVPCWWSRTWVARGSG